MAKANGKAHPAADEAGFANQLVELRKSLAARTKHLREETPHFEMTVADLAGKRYPNLSMWTLATCDIEDYEKKNGWSCWVDEEGWHGLLNSRGWGLRKFLSAETLDALLDAMEAFLGREEQDWTYQSGKRQTRSRGRSRSNGKHTPHQD